MYCLLHACVYYKNHVFFFSRNIEHLGNARYVMFTYTLEHDLLPGMEIKM